MCSRFVCVKMNNGQDNKNVEMANGEDDHAPEDAGGVVSHAFENVGVFALRDDGSVTKKFLSDCKVVAEYDPEVRAGLIL